jgi:hypothetical protein
MTQTLLPKVEKILKDIEDKVDEYASNITGYQETEYMDILYEDYITFLESVQGRLKQITDIMYMSNETI